MLVGVVADQWSKLYAESRLATQRLDHEVVLTAPMAQTVDDLLAAEFEWNTDEQNDAIAARYARDAENRPVRGDDALEPGATIKVLQREVIVVPDYFDFQYTRNPGAAFGLLSRADSPWRAPFFLAVSSIALIVIVFHLARDAAPASSRLVWGLSLIASGRARQPHRSREARLRDRLYRLEKYTDAHRWPTFNIARRADLHRRRADDHRDDPRRAKTEGGRVGLRRGRRGRVRRGVTRAPRPARA